MAANDPHRFVRRERQQDFACERCGEVVSLLTMMGMDQYQVRALLHFTQCWTKEERQIDDTDQARFVAWAGG